MKESVTLHKNPLGSRIIQKNHLFERKEKGTRESKWSSSKILYWYVFLTSRTKVISWGKNRLFWDQVCFLSGCLKKESQHQSHDLVPSSSLRLDANIHHFQQFSACLIHLQSMQYDMGCIFGSVSLRKSFPFILLTWGEQPLSDHMNKKKAPSLLLMGVVPSLRYRELSSSHSLISCTDWQIAYIACIIASMHTVSKSLERRQN